MRCLNGKKRFYPNCIGDRGMRMISYKENYQEMSLEAAEVMCSVIKDNPKAVIVLATGHSPLLAYRIFVEMVRDNGLDLSAVTFIKLDEWAGLSAENRATCEYFLQKEILKPLGIPSENYLGFRMQVEDLQAECKRIEDEYARLQRIDLVILGIGKNGHLGLNEPGDLLIGPAHSIGLDEKTKTHEMLSHSEQTVNQGITLGMRNIFRGVQILLLADGADKEEGLRTLFSDVITTRCPVSLLRLHPNCNCIINMESFTDLKG